MSPPRVIQFPLLVECIECKKQKSITDFHKSPGGLFERQRRCKKCVLVRLKKDRKENKEKWRKYDRKRYLKDRYKISVNDWDEMLSNQSGGCAICGDKLGDIKLKRRLHVDHDHNTGIVRGLLCGACNYGIDKFRDDPSLLRLAATYLERNSKPK